MPLQTGPVRVIERERTHTIILPCDTLCHITLQLPLFFPEQKQTKQLTCFSNASSLPCTSGIAAFPDAMCSRNSPNALPFSTPDICPALNELLDEGALMRGEGGTPASIEYDKKLCVQFDAI